MNDGYFERVFADWQEHTRRELDRRVATATCLSFSQLRELSGSEPSDVEQHHLKSCRRCRELREGFQKAQQAQPFLADPGGGS